MFALGKIFRPTRRFAQMLITPLPPLLLPDVPLSTSPGVFFPGHPVVAGGVATITCAVDPDEEDDDLGDEEDLSIAQPLADEESSFDDFDDEFDDDFEEEENDPDWDHPDDSDSEEPPPAKGPGRKK